MAKYLCFRMVVISSCNCSYKQSMFFQASKSQIQKAEDNKLVGVSAGCESSHTPVSTIYIFITDEVL